jgi:hypothetical protein
MVKAAEVAAAVFYLQHLLLLQARLMQSLLEQAEVALEDLVQVVLVVLVLLVPY